MGFVVGLFVLETIFAGFLVWELASNPRHIAMSPWVASTFFAGVFTQLAILFRQVNSYLFTDRTGPPLTQMIAGVFQASRESTTAG